MTRGWFAAGRRGDSLDEQSPLETARDRCGPYVWGKLESELRASRLATELGLELKIVRPGAVVDYESFEPPGRLGKRVGNVFVAVGPRRSRLVVVELDFAARVIAWFALRLPAAPPTLNLLAPSLPTRAELVRRLRRSNPDLTVIWIPRVVLVPLSWLALALQKLLRRGRPAVDVARVFAPQSYRTTAVASIAPSVAALFTEPPLAETVLARAPERELAAGV